MAGCATPSPWPWTTEGNDTAAHETTHEGTDDEASPVSGTWRGSCHAEDSAYYSDIALDLDLRHERGLAMVWGSAIVVPGNIDYEGPVEGELRDDGINLSIALLPGGYTWELGLEGTLDGDAIAGTCRSDGHALGTFDVTRS